MTEFMHPHNAGERYHYTDSGLDNIWLIGGVDRVETPYGMATSIRDLDELHLAIGRVIAAKALSSGEISGAEFRFLRQELELSQKALGRLLHCNEQQIHRWEGDKSGLPGTAAVALAGYYMEATDPDSRVKDLLDRYAELDALEAKSEMVFTMTQDHWEPEAA